MMSLAQGSPPTSHWLVIVVGVVILVISAGILAVLARRSLLFGIWSFCSWTYVTLAWRCSTKLKRKGVVLAGLTDYVHLLEDLRVRLVKYVDNRPRQNNNSEKPGILIRVYTHQLPSDWPVWDSNVDQQTHNLTPLERYAINLRTFVDEAPQHDHNIHIRRVIVIDSKFSDAGVSRRNKLAQDVNPVDDDDIQRLARYIRLLHTGWDDAFYCEYERPWPGWLSDIVFYGLRLDGIDKWLWAVTSSFNPHEDLVLLRLHSGLGAIRNLKDWPLPDNYETLERLARDAGAGNGMFPLKSLVTASPETSTK